MTQQNFTNNDTQQFEWPISKKGYTHYASDVRNDLETNYVKTFRSINENEVITAKVVYTTNTDVILDIGYKSDGLVPLSEFRGAEIKPGQIVEVYVELKENKKGIPSLSYRKAALLRAWENINKAHEEGTIVTGKILSKTKGGLIVDIFGLETFLPGSQIDVRPVTDYDIYVGKTMDFKVVKINEIIKNAVVSHKALIESDIQEQRQKIIGKLERGQVLEGTVKNITDFGAFIDLGGVDGLLYITDISWGRISHPSEVLTLGQKIDVVVIEFDEEKRRISLGLKQLTPHPWEVLDSTLQEGSTVSGKIVNIEDYGAFLEVTPGVEGLIHISEVSWSNQPINPREYFKISEPAEAKIVTIDRAERKMSLSIKQLKADPWSIIEENFPINSKHIGEVKNTTPYGVFIELSEGIGGMVHISDLSWVKRFNHPNEYVKVGDKMEVVILNIDKENRKLSLGHKQIESDPWDAFENIFSAGSEHEGKIIRRDEKGATVLLPHGLEAYASVKHLRKADNTIADLEETLPFKIVEFDKTEKRIVISHTDLVRATKEAEEQAHKTAEEQAEQEAREQIQELNAQTEATTLGDASEALSQLKSKLEEQQ